MKIFRDKGVTLSRPYQLWANVSDLYVTSTECHSVPTAKLQEIFGPILLKKIKISNAHNFGNTCPIKEIPTLLSSEAGDFPL